MSSEKWTLRTYATVSQTCGVFAAIVAGIALSGWFAGSDVLRGVKPGYIPMAPNTALLFLLLGTLLVMLPLQRAMQFVRFGAIIILLIATARLAEYLIGVDLTIDEVFFRFPSDTLGLAPVGKMAFFTAITFLLLATGLLLTTFHKHWTNDAAKAFGLIVSFIGLAFSLGYLYGAPLLYGSKSIPMALNTAICFCLSGVGILIKASLHDLQERRQTAVALQEAHQQLERRVKERTYELSTVVSSLEAEIEERKQAEQALLTTEEQLRQSQKLEAVGRLAGGIAHDFNNLLTVIIGYSDLLLRRNDFDSTVQEKLIEINKASTRAASLTRQLLAFSRKQVMKPEALSINSILEGTEKMLRRLIGEDIEVITNLRPGVGTIVVDPSQIEQVVLNLVVNARDAMRNGGKLVIETSNVELDRTYADLHMSVQPGSYVMLSVSDSGVGMDLPTQKKIFEPFFTTKEVGKGTGLGLSMVYGIVKQCGGNIWVYSEMGRGTTFKIYWPRVDAEVAADAASRNRHEQIYTASETILLVEDDDMVRKLACDILTSKGYRLLVAADGDEALSIALNYDRPIDLLLTDVVMPRATGKEVAEALTAYRSEMAVVFMSGYTDDAIAHHGVLEPGTHLIEKPFTADLLLSQIAAVLARRRDQVSC
ncbi:MAG: ATP-binding protein [Pyrinomonadaceae bacterium]